MVENEIGNEVLWKAVKVIIYDPHKNIVDDNIIDRFISCFDHSKISSDDSFIYGMTEMINSDDFERINQNAAFRISSLVIPTSLHVTHSDNPTQLLIHAMMNRTLEIVLSTNLSSIYGFLEALTGIVQSFPVLEILMQFNIADNQQTENQDPKVKDLTTLVHYFLNFRRSQHIVTITQQLFRKLICAPTKTKINLDTCESIPKFMPKLKTLVTLSIEEFSINALLEIKSLMTQMKAEKQLKQFVKLYSIDRLLLDNLDRILSLRQDLSVKDLVVYCQCLAIALIESCDDESVLKKLINCSNANLIKPIAAYIIVKGYPENSIEQRYWSKYILYPLLVLTDNYELTRDKILELKLEDTERAHVDKLVDRSFTLFILAEISKTHGRVFDLKMLRKIIDIMSCYVINNMDKSSYHREVMESIRVLHHLCRLYITLPKITIQTELRHLLSVLTDLGEKMTNDLFLFQIFKGLRILTESPDLLNPISIDVEGAKIEEHTVLNLIFQADEKRRFTSLILKICKRALNSKDPSLMGDSLLLLATYIEKTGFDTISEEAELSSLIVLEIWPWISRIHDSYLVAQCLSIMTAIDLRNVYLNEFGFTQFRHITYLMISYLCDIETDFDLREKIITLLSVSTPLSKAGYLCDILNTEEISPKEKNSIIDKMMFGTCLSIRLGMSSICLNRADFIITQTIEHLKQLNQSYDVVVRLVKANIITTLYEIFSSFGRFEHDHKRIFVGSCLKIKSFLEDGKNLESLSKALPKCWPKIKDETSNGLDSAIPRESVLREMDLINENDPQICYLSSSKTQTNITDPTVGGKKILSILDIYQSDLQLPEITVSKKTKIEEVLEWYASGMISHITQLSDENDKKAKQLLMERAAIMDVLACENKKLDCPKTECY